VPRLRRQGPGVPCGGGGVAVSEVEGLSPVEPRTRQLPASQPAFRGPLSGQRPRVRNALGGDPWLVLSVGALVGLGTVMVFNVSYFYGDERFGDGLLFFRKHLVSVALGLMAAIVAARLPSATYRKAAYPLLLVVLVALLLVLVPGIGVSRSGA